MTTFHYGIDSSADLELADGAAPIELGASRGEPLDDPAAAIAVALDNPLDYPPLAKGTTPADQVVLAIEHGLPEPVETTAAVIRTLTDAGVDPDGITVLRTRADVEAGAEDPCSEVPEAIRERISLITHDPTNRDVLAYLAANDAGDPIVIHRALHHADLVLPIGCLHAETAPGYYGIHGSIYPGFSDEKTQSRFRSVASLDVSAKHRKRLVNEVGNVAWLLGVSFTIQCIPAAGGGILHALAGKSDSVRARGDALYRAAWQSPGRRAAPLVVAAVEGSTGQQTWENFGLALQNATDLVEEDGAIAVCCDLATAPGPAMQRIIGARERDTALRRIRKERPHDALPAAQLGRALDRGKVYLLSSLKPSVVEGLEMIHLGSADELARLTRQHTSAILLANAPYVTLDQTR